MPCTFVPWFVLSVVQRIPHVCVAISMKSSPPVRQTPDYMAQMDLKYGEALVVLSSVKEKCTIDRGTYCKVTGGRNHTK